MREEVGLSLPQAAIVGRLDDFITRSGFIMTPVVVWVGPRRDLQRSWLRFRETLKGCEIETGRETPIPIESPHHGYGTRAPFSA